MGTEDEQPPGDLEEVDVDDPDNVEWRQSDQGWEFLGSDGQWYLGEGPEEERETAWRKAPSGRWQYQAADGNWYFPKTQPTSAPRRAASAPSYSTVESPSSYSTIPSQPSDTTAGAWLAIIGGALMVIGAFLPWWHVFGGLIVINRNGFQLGTDESFSADGLVQVGLGIVAALIGITRLARSSMPRYFQRSPIVVAIVAGIALASSGQGIHETKLGAAVSSTIGYGVWVTGIGVAIVLISGLVLRQKATDGMLK